MALTPAELLEKALNGDSLDGDDTGEQGDLGSGGASDAQGTASDEDQYQNVAQQNDNEDNTKQPASEEQAGAPIVSKSGEYTIPYEKLEQARDRAKNLEGENATLRAQLAELTAKQQANLNSAEARAQDRADAGQAQTQADQNLEAAKEAIANGADPALFGDFSEEGLAKGIGIHTAELVSKSESRTIERVEQMLEEKLAPFHAKQVKETSDSHYEAIYGKHPDANEIAQSNEFAAWLQSLPGFSRNAISAVLDPNTGGTAAEVIEVLDTFKAQTGRASAPATQGKGKAPEVQRRVPHSLSEAAGEQHQDVTQQVMATAGTNPGALIERMQDMTPEQVDRLLNAL